MTTFMPSPPPPYGNQATNFGFQPGFTPNQQFEQGFTPNQQFDFKGGMPPGPGAPFETSPVPPNTNQGQNIPGYEFVTQQDEIITPPTAPDWPTEAPKRDAISGIPTLAEEEVRDAVVQYASQKCCYGGKAAREMVFNDINMTSAYHYSLETFGEKRESAWRYDPYEGQPIDGPMNGPAPGPWDVMILPQDYFHDAKVKMEVPHTAFVKPCHGCVGNGRIRCTTCNGHGTKDCTWCHGSGRRFDDRCTSCNASGRQRCMSCSGHGQITCKTCNGKGNLKGFVQLTVTWTNHVEDFITETSSLPKDQIRQVSGHVVVDEQNQRVWPILNSGDSVINEASNTIIQKHNQCFPTERIIKQRQRLRIIPIAQARFSWKEKNGVFYVYGFENKVHFEKYPQKCCCIL